MGVQGVWKNTLFWLMKTFINYGTQLAMYKYTAVKVTSFHMQTGFKSTSSVPNELYMLKVLLTNKGYHFEFICGTMAGLEPPLEESDCGPAIHLLIIIICYYLLSQYLQPLAMLPFCSRANLLTRLAMQLNVITKDYCIIICNQALVISCLYHVNYELTIVDKFKNVNQLGIFIFKSMLMSINSYCSYGNCMTTHCNACIQGNFYALIKWVASQLYKNDNFVVYQYFG